MYPGGDNYIKNKLHSYFSSIVIEVMTDGLGSLVKSIITLLLCLDPVPKERPVITLSQKDTVILRTGERFELTCSSTNVNPDLSLKWDVPLTAVRFMLGMYLQGRCLPGISVTVNLLGPASKLGQS